MARYHTRSGGHPWHYTLTNIRCEAGVSRKELAAKAGVHPSTVWRVETGEQPPSQGLLDAYGELAKWIGEKG